MRVLRAVSVQSAASVLWLRVGFAWRNVRAESASVRRTGGALWTPRAGHAPGDSRRAWISSNVTCSAATEVTSLRRPKQGLKEILLMFTS